MISNMLASNIKQQDAQTLRDLWDMVGIGMNVYMKTEDERILKETQEVMAFAERLKEKMNTHDYTNDDLSEYRIIKMFERP